MNSPNPYEAPRSEDSLPFSTADSSVADLERRIAELERQVARTWFLKSNVLLTTLAVWGYFLLGYALIVAIAAPIIFLLDFAMKL